MTDESEEIFRRAAESYPLKANNPDWEELVKKMENAIDDNAAGEILPVIKKRKYGRFLLLLLLLISFAIVEYKYSTFSNLFPRNKNTQSKQTGDGSGLPAKTQDGQLTSSNKKISANSSADFNVNPPDLLNNKAGKMSSSQISNSDSSENRNTSSDLNIAPAENITSIGNAEIKSRDGRRKQIISQKEKNKFTPQKNYAGNTAEDKGNASRRNTSFSAKQKTKAKVITPTTADGDETKVYTTTKLTPAEKPGTKANNNDSTLLASTKLPIENHKEEVKTPVEQDTAKTTNPEKQKKNQSHQKHFYAGVLAGPDFSTIKLQSVKKTGYSYGLILGYRLNNKFSVETGFLFDKKMYSSKGQYFSTKNIAVYPNTTIAYVTGQCNMYEIPLNVRYIFSERKGSTWFAVAGISSYLMKKEMYVYDVLYQGMTHPYPYDYKSHDNHLAAVVNLSFGYSCKLNKIGDLRFEPYVKLPVAKVGTGELPIQSFGLMVGFTRNLF